MHVKFAQLNEPCRKSLPAQLKATSSKEFAIQFEVVIYCMSLCHIEAEGESFGSLGLLKEVNVAISWRQ